MYAMTRIRTEWAALALGLALAAVFVLSQRVGGETSAPAANVEIVTAPSAQFAITPDGVTSGEGALTPSSPDGGFEREVTVRNATAEPLEARAALPNESSPLDGALQARIQFDDRVVYDGPVRGLSSGSDPYPLASGQTAQLSILVWIPESISGDHWEARSATLPIVLASSVEAD